MYKIFSMMSLLIRAVICYFTIETTPVFENSLIAYGVDQIVSLYSIMWLISYAIVGRVFGYQRSDDPTLGAILYFFVYTVVAMVTWGILALLTFFDIIPL